MCRCQGGRIGNIRGGCTKSGLDVRMGWWRLFYGGGEEICEVEVEVEVEPGFAERGASKARRIQEGEGELRSSLDVVGWVYESTVGRALRRAVDVKACNAGLGSLEICIYLISSDWRTDNFICTSGHCPG